MYPKLPSENHARGSTLEGFARRHPAGYFLSVVAITVAICCVTGVLVGLTEHSSGWGLLGAGAAGIALIVIGLVIISVARAHSAKHR